MKNSSKMRGLIPLGGDNVKCTPKAAQALHDGMGKLPPPGVWTWGESHPRPLPCQGSALLLSYKPDIMKCARSCAALMDLERAERAQRSKTAQALQTGASIKEENEKLNLRR